jgi:hypothetical protein
MDHTFSSCAQVSGMGADRMPKGPVVSGEGLGSALDGHRAPLAVLDAGDLGCVLRARLHFPMIEVEWIPVPSIALWSIGGGPLLQREGDRPQAPSSGSM